MSTSLVILAAGMGRRYGGLKQMDAVGPSGEFILDYSVYDALQAGFDRAVFIVRREIEDAFREVVGNRLARQIAVDYVCQDMTDGLDGTAVPAGRTKPWGTAHAVMVCHEVVSGPFVAANADDFYGRETFEVLGRFLRDTAGQSACYAMPGFILRNAVSEHGSVARGVCDVDAAGRLQGVVERTDIEHGADGYRCTGQDLTGAEIVSMNIWALKPSIFGHLQNQFAEFLQARGQDPQAEFFLPTVINRLIAAGTAQVNVLETPCVWFGATYPQDKPRVVEQIAAQVNAGRYPRRLWD